MATIDRDVLLAEEKIYLPETNVLTDEQMMTINDMVIANEVTADDEIYHAEALCKCLRALGNINLSKATTGSSGIKRDKVGDVETEWFDSTNTSGWKEFIDSLSTLCPMFGYYGLPSRGGIKITTSCPPRINPCCNNDDLTY